MNLAPVRAIDLIGYCQHSDSASFAHELVRRLIVAEGARVEGFAPHEALQDRSWDGISVAADASGIVPAGISNWEISAQNAGLHGKANEDFAKRLAAARENETYVVVFLQRWRGKVKWSLEKAADSLWRDVVAYDVDDLISALEAHPRVHEWATRRIRGELRVVPSRGPLEVPPLPPTLVRRRALEREVHAAFDYGRCAAIWGGPGLGKSTLATVVAHDIKGQFPDGVFYVSSDDIDQEEGDYEALQRRVVTALAPFASTGDSHADYRSAVAGRRVLVIADNVSNEKLLSRVLVDGVWCISTSRRRLSGVALARHIETVQMTPSESVEVLRFSDPSTDDASEELVAKVARLCAHIPLALQIAGSLAALNPEWGMAGVMAELERRHGALAALSIGDRALQATFQTAVEALPDDAELAFRAIAQIPGRVIDANLVGLASGQTELEARSSLRTLREYALVRPTDWVGAYYVHDLLYEYIEDLAQRTPMPSAARNRAAVVNWFFQTAVAHSDAIIRNTHLVRNAVLPADAADAIEWFGRFANSLLIGARFAGEVLQQHEPAIQAFNCLMVYYQREQRWADLATAARTSRRWINSLYRGSRSARTNDVEIESLRYLMVEAEAEYHLENYSKAESLLAAASSIPAPGSEITANIQSLLGGIRVDQGRAAEGLAHYQAAAELTAAHPDSVPHVTALYNVGIGYFRIGEDAKALPYLERELAAVRRFGNQHGEGITLNTVGLVLRRLGRVTEAREALERSVEALAAGPDRVEHANALYDLAALMLDAGEHSSALKHLEAELEMRRELGDVVGAARTRATILLNSVDAQDIESFLESAEHLIHELPDDIYWQASLRIRCAEAHFTLGRRSEAKAHLRQVIAREALANEPYPRGRMLDELRATLTSITKRKDLQANIDDLRVVVERLPDA